MKKIAYLLFLIFLFLFYSEKTSAAIIFSDSLVTFKGRIVTMNYNEDTIPLKASIAIFLEEYRLDTIKVSSDSTGFFTVNLKRDKTYYLIASAKHYLTRQNKFETLDKDILMSLVLPKAMDDSGMVCVIKNIYFEPRKYDILPDGEIESYKISEFLKNNPLVKLKLVGHTDNSESKRDNKKLSLKRAIAVKDNLISKGVNSKQLEVEGKGNRYSLVPNDSPENRALNRRVEITLTNTQ